MIERVNLKEGCQSRVQWEKGRVLRSKEVGGVCTGDESRAVSTGVDIAWGAVGGLKAFSKTGGVST